jgi:hypothetical protein
MQYARLAPCGLAARLIGHSPYKVSADWWAWMARRPTRIETRLTTDSSFSSLALFARGKKSEMTLRGSQRAAHWAGESQPMERLPSRSYSGAAWVVKPCASLLRLCEIHSRPNMAFHHGAVAQTGRSRRQGLAQILSGACQRQKGQSLSLQASAPNFFYPRWSRGPFPHLLSRFLSRYLSSSLLLLSSPSPIRRQI